MSRTKCGFVAGSMSTRTSSKRESQSGTGSVPHPTCNKRLTYAVPFHTDNPVRVALTSAAQAARLLVTLINDVAETTEAA
jgi:hypothetical protein